MAKRKVKQYQIPGTALKVPAQTYTKLMKGKLSYESFARSVSKHNASKLRNLFKDPEYFMVNEMAAGAISPSNMVNRVKASYRSSLYKYDKGLLLKESMVEIIRNTYDDVEITALKAKLNMTDLNFDDWYWNSATQRLELSTIDGRTIWLKVEGRVKNDDYSQVSIETGEV